MFQKYRKPLKEQNIRIFMEFANIRGETTIFGVSDEEDFIDEDEDSE